MTTMRMHYVDPHTPVLRSVSRAVRVENVRSPMRSVETAAGDLAGGAGSEKLAALRREQRAIEARLRLLEDEAASAEAPPPDGSAFEQRHAAKLASYDAMISEQERSAALGLQRAQALHHYSTPASHASVRIDTTAEVAHRVVPGIDEVVSEVGAASAYELLASQSHADVKARARRGVVVQPFSFEARERARKAAPSVREEKKKRDEMIRVQKEQAAVARPAGERGGFAATPVPPSTFLNKFELLQIEAEERRFAAKDRARRLAETSKAPEPSLLGYISEPLRRPVSYVPVSEKMNKYRFKARRVPPSVKSPQWHRIAEAEVIRKMDIKEAARFKLAKYNADLPSVMRSMSSCALNASQTRPQSARRSNSVSDRVPGMSSECRFQPAINKNVPDFFGLHERDRLLKSARAGRPKTTHASPFRLSSRSAARTEQEVKFDMEMDEYRLPEQRWPYVSPRGPLPRSAVPVSVGPSAPTRYTRAAKMQLLASSVRIIQREEDRQRCLREAELRDQKQKGVASRLKHALGAGDSPARKPIWLRGGDHLAEDAAQRAHADEVAGAAPPLRYDDPDPAPFVPPAAKSSPKAESEPDKKKDKDEISSDSSSDKHKVSTKSKEADSDSLDSYSDE
ncbi:hypothetical protein DIPPA_17504 [Diplonema papillatum]|nr:hypothetical protein DIPPA_17504 [Diplonema papillatum]